MLVALLVSACATSERIVYTGPVAADQATQGFPRLVDDDVEVQVQGTTAVGNLPDVKGWFVIHPEHLKRFIENTEMLQKIRAHKVGQLVINELSGGNKVEEVQPSGLRPVED